MLSHQRRHELREVQHEREIPGCDQPRYPDGFANHDPVALHPEKLMNTELALPFVLFGNLDIPGADGLASLAQVLSHALGILDRI